MAIIVKNIKRPPVDVIRKFTKISVATIHESLGKETNSAMDPAIKSIGQGMKLLGPAVTVDCFPADNISVHLAMTVCKRGDVIVVNAHGVRGVMWGGQMTLQAVTRGIGGVVVDGAVRDTDYIRTMNFPCFASIISPLGSAKETPGSVNVPIQCGGVVVNPGDLISGDADGVVVVPRRRVREVLLKARARDAKEAKDRRLLTRGKRTAELYGLIEVARAKGVRETELVPLEG